MKRKTGKKPRKPKPKPSPALKVLCPSCGAPPTTACILLTAAPLSRKALKGQFDVSLAAIESPAPHASRLAAYEASFKTRARRRPR